MRKLIAILLMISAPALADTTISGPVTYGSAFDVSGAHVTGLRTAKVSTIVCNGTTDVTAVMQAEIDAYSTAGGGEYQIKPGSQCVIGTADDLTLPYNIQITCSMNGGGIWNGDPVANADFLINSAHSIITSTANLGGRSGVFGCAIVRDGYVAPTNLRTSIQAANAFAGTALVCTGTQDVTFQDNLVLGFAEGITGGCSRLNVRRNRIDSTNGFRGVVCYDTCYISENEVWPFSNSSDLGYDTTQDSTISSITNDGGLFKVTLSAPPATPLVNGDVIVIHDAGGVPTANNRWVITVVDSTNFTLDGSTFAGTDTGGGKAFLVALRTGTAFEFGDGQFFGHLNVAFGWDKDLVFTGLNDGSTCHRCWLEGWQVSKDPVPIAVYSTSTSANAEYSGYIGTPGRGIVMDGTSPGQALRISDSFIAGGGAAAGGVSAITIMTGAFQMTGGGIFGSPANANAYYLDNSANNVRLTNVVIPTGLGGFEAASVGCPKLTIDGVVGPCAFTPVISGDGDPGTFTYTAQDGVWTQSRIGVSAYVSIAWSAITGAPSGTTTNITGFPVTSGPIPGPCVIGYSSGLTMTSGQITTMMGVPVSSAYATLTQTDIAGATTAYAPSQLASAGSIQAECRYQP